MREMARLQTFPDSFNVLGSVSDAQRQLGNAVPSLMAEVIARAMRKQLLKSPAKGVRPVLAIERAARTGRPERCQSVPQRYLELRGEHLAHPGTGQGFRATAQSRGASLLAAE